jgi:hypothetical protein
MIAAGHSGNETRTQPTGSLLFRLLAPCAISATAAVLLIALLIAGSGDLLTLAAATKESAASILQELSEAVITA